MKKLPQNTTLQESIAEMLLEMSVGGLTSYDTTNRNFSTFRQSFYAAVKTLDGKWITQYDKEENIFTIIRIK